MRTTLLVWVGAAIALAVTVWLVLQQWAELGVNLSGHGWFAYALGAIASIAVSAGLFFALFYSARSGFDDIDRPEDRSGKDDRWGN